MSGSAGLKKPKKSPVAIAAEKLVGTRLEENQIEDFEKIGTIWATMLDLDTPMIPSQVAALLCVSDIVRATTLIDSKKHWIEAAVLAMVGAHADEALISVESSEEQRQEEQQSSQARIGFVASSSNQL